METHNEMAKWLEAVEIQKVQDSFSELTGMAAVTLDLEGNPLTKKSNFTKYCEIFLSHSNNGASLCTECCRYGAKEAYKLCKATSYYCHLGLVEYSSPIIIDGITIAYLVGGMVFENAPDENTVREYARRYEIDGDYLWEAAKKVPVCDPESIGRAANFLYNVSSVMANMASARMHMEEAERQIQEASRMKNDFIANMSHEIRTPMNAVIGMTDVVLKEEVSPSVHEYVSQIQSSGKTLLQIVNDILDYSHLANGNFELVEDEYSPVNLLHDIAGELLDTLKQKNEAISLYVDIDPSVPSKLKGDENRIRQVLMNIASNAVKFTTHGHIRISIRSNKINSKNVMLSVSIEDTGIGIKPEDLDKLFGSFYQIDSRRNRSNDGAGLGLAISHALVGIMNGKLSVESAYEKGSVFTVEIPQELVDSKRVAEVPSPEKYAILTYIENRDLSESLHNTADLMGINVFSSRKHPGMGPSFKRWTEDYKNKERFVFIDEANLSNGSFEELNLVAKEYNCIHRVLIAESISAEEIQSRFPFLNVIRKPIFTDTLAALLRGESEKESSSVTRQDSERFTAEEAKVLIVDDNKVNLRVAEKLLSLVGISADKALSGGEALELVEKNRYDLIFMDHMMPEMDGVETTRLIRRLHPDLENMPIVALTANTMEESIKFFLEEGMNDFVAKPIDSKIINKVLVKWLPTDKINYV